jgi:hypothetical protein
MAKLGLFPTVCDREYDEWTAVTRVQPKRFRNPGAPVLRPIFSPAALEAAPY